MAAGHLGRGFFHPLPVDTRCTGLPDLMEAIMFMPTEIIVVASLALSLFLVTGVWSVAVPDVEEWSTPYESAAVRLGVRNCSTSAVTTDMSALIPPLNR